MEDSQSKKKGKQKIQIRRIEREQDRLITFTKRRSEIYKKATQIGTLCATEVGILMLSPSGKPYSYGVPNIETVMSRLMNREVEGDNDISQGVVEAFRRVKMEDLNKSCDELTIELQRLKNEGVMLAEEKKEMLKESGEQEESLWWDIPVADLNIAEMKQTILTMEEMKKSAGYRLHDIALAGSTSSSFNQNQNLVNEMVMNLVDSDKIPSPSTTFYDPNAFGLNNGNEER